MKKNILFVADIVPYPPNTGIKIRTYNIIKQLHKKFNVILIAFNHRIFFPEKKDLEIAIKSLNNFCNEIYILDIPSDRNKIQYYLCLFKNLFSLNPYRVQRYWSNECEKVIKNILNSKHIDLVHFDKTEFFEYSKYFNKIPIVITNHNVESKLMKYRSKYEVSFLRKFFAFLQYLKTEKYERKSLNEVDAFITCTKNDLQYFTKHIKVENLHAIIENGVDVENYKPGLNSEEDYFLIIGAQSKEATANYDATHYFMKKIWPELIKKIPNIKLKIVGRNPDKSIIDYGFNDHRIEVIGFVEDERDVLEKSLALLVPLRLGGGSRLKIITAMAMKKTVISTTIGAEGIQCNNNHNVIIADEPKLFAEKIVNIYYDRELRNKIGMNALNLVHNVYDWNIIGNKIINFYDKICAIKYE